jgi:hypothetical protein
MEDGASSPAPPNCRTPYCFLRDQAAVDYHSRSGHEARVVGRQEHDAERDVLGDADRPGSDAAWSRHFGPPRQAGLTWLINHNHWLTTGAYRSLIS